MSRLAGVDPVLMQVIEDFEKSAHAVFCQGQLAFRQHLEILVAPADHKLLDPVVERENAAGPQQRACQDRNRRLPPYPQPPAPFVQSLKCGTAVKRSLSRAARSWRRGP